MKTPQQEKQRQAVRLPYNDRLHRVGTRLLELSVVVTSFLKTARSRGSATLQLVLLLLTLALPARATTYYVSGGMGNNAYDGLTNIVVSSMDGPKLNISNAVAAAFTGDTVDVADGFYQETNWDLTGKDLTLNPDGTVIVYNSNPWSTFTIGDGISDGWRQYYFADATTTNSDSCASCDPDADGQSNLAEYLAGSDPLDYFSGLLQPPLCFTNQFTATNTEVIAIQPSTNGCIFYAGESVTVTSSAPIEVYQLTYGGQTAPYASGASPLVINPPVGHYFVQSAGDRNEFVVFPANYGTLNNVGHDDYYALASPEIGVHQPRAKLGWVRPVLHWVNIQTNNGGAFNWSAIVPGTTTPEESNLLYWVGREKIVLLADPAGQTWATNLAFSSWLAAYSNFQAVAYSRYSNDVDVLQPLNEPYQNMSINLVFTNSNYGTFQVSAYKAIATAFPNKPLIGPSESTPNQVFSVAFYAAAGGTSQVSALDYHDYTEKNGNASPESVTVGIVPQAMTNLSAMAASNLFLTEAGIAGASAIGWPPTEPADDGEHSDPTYNWYRGMTRAMKVATLYEQFDTTILVFNFMDDAPIEIAGFDPNGGIKPKTSAFLMSEYWLNGSIPVTNWTSANLHFASSVFTNGTTNTFVWSSEGTQTTTNLGTFVSDIWSNEWTGAIGEEPLIAWGWPAP